MSLEIKENYITYDTKDLYEELEKCNNRENENHPAIDVKDVSDWVGLNKLNYFKEKSFLDKSNININRSDTIKIFGRSKTDRIEKNYDQSSMINDLRINSIKRIPMIRNSGLNIHNNTLDSEINLKRSNTNYKKNEI